MSSMAVTWLVEISGGGVKVSSIPLGLAVLAGVLAAITSLIGIFFPNTYARETPAWAVQALGQDCANVLVALILLWTSAWVRRRSMRAMLIWFGCLLYFIYAFAIYSFAVHFNTLFPLYVAVLGLSFYAFVGQWVGLDAAEATQSLIDHPHRVGASNLLIAMGALFALLWLAEIVPHVIAHSVPTTLSQSALPTNPVHVLDLGLLLPAMIIVGVLLRRQHPLGLLFGVPLLVFAVTMGLGILCLLALSASKGLPSSAPAAAVVALIVGGSGMYAWLLLRPVRLPSTGRR